jgi:tRNA(Ile)-lysidine synthase
MLKVKFPPGKKTGLAVSGGVDSMVMLDLGLKSGADIAVINFEHGIRGEESKKDSEFVAEVCRRQGIRLLRFSLDVPARSAQDKESMELAARKMRYEIFEKLLAAGEADVIALAHHIDDQCETLLMRIFRGTGIRGLAGIADSDKYIHPLLSYSKAEILEYARANNIAYREDKTNSENEYTRNYIRNVILPLIKERYPNVEKSLAKLAENCAETEEYLEKQRIGYQEKEGAYMLPAAISLLHPLIAKYSVAGVLRAMGIYHDIESKHYADLLKLARKQTGKRINLPMGITAYAENGNLVFTRGEQTDPYCERFSPEKTYEHNGVSYAFTKAWGRCASLAFDIDKLPADVLVRTRREGDIFKACNGRTKLLSDYLQQKNIPLRVRNSLLLLAKEQTIYAVLGTEISDLIKIDENTKNIYEIKKA